MIKEGYSAGLMSQSFWFVETKKVVQMYYRGKTETEIKRLCLEENLLGAAKEYRAKRMMNYIWNRVKLMDSNLASLFMSSDLATQKIINLILILEGDRLFFEFLYEVYREKVILGMPCLEASDVNVFFKNKEAQSELIEKWSETTKKHLRSNYLNFMTDANLLSVVQKEKRITPPILDAQLENYLRETHNMILLKAITGAN